MRRLTIVLLCALLLPACLTTGLWEWAGDTQPTSPRPINCGMDADGATVILVAAAGEEQPTFCLRVPVNWRDRIQIPVGESGESVHSPLFLSPEPVLAGALADLEPAPEEWFLSHEPETGSVDVLVSNDGGYLVVGTAELPAEVHWERRLVAAVLTPATVAVDTVVMVSALLFFIWIDFDFPWPWKIDSEDESGASSDPKPPSGSDTGLIFPAHGPS